MNTDSAHPNVFLVGAGPGSPGLLTVRAAEVLARADLVIYDQLVPERLLDFAPPSAEKVCVRDLPGQHPDEYPHIHQLLIQRARQGQTVVRLKGGDPLIFGRGGEEAEALRGAGVAYEIVPGVTAALAAGSYLEIPLTHRKHASAIALVTGHELPHKPGNRLDWKALAAFPGTLAIYMGIARLPVIVGELIKHGKSPDTPAAIVERVSWASSGPFTRGSPTSRRLAAWPGSKHRDSSSSAWRSPNGPSGRGSSRALFGRRVLVTRPAHQAPGMVRKLEDLGAVVARMSTIEIREPGDLAPVDAALAQLRSGEWDWLVFTSANGIRALLARLELLERDLRDLGGVKLAAIGPKTAEVLREYHLRADLVPDAIFSSEGLVAALAPRVAGQRVLLARANRGRELIREELAKVARTVEQVTVYDQVDSVEPNPLVIDALRRGEIRYVTLPSSNIARCVLGTFDETIRGRIARGDIQLIAISPETGGAIRRLGLPVAAEAEVFTEDGMIEALVRLASADPAH